MSSSRPSIPRLSVPPPIQPRSRALAYGVVSVLFLLAIAATWKLGPRAYNWARLRELEGRNVYDLSLDPVRTVDAAVVRAQREQRQVLVILGGNWCKWCLALDDLMSSDASIKEHLAKHYVVVKLDSAKAKVLDERWGKPTKHGVPVLIFVDQHGQARHVQETVSLERWQGRILSHDPDRVLALLKSWS